MDFGAKLAILTHKKSTNSQNITEKTAFFLKYGFLYPVILKNVSMFQCRSIFGSVFLNAIEKNGIYIKNCKLYFAICNKKRTFAAKFVSLRKNRTIL